jgi:murein DD-endopeptidase MepM/ murein hydrolase activator NlpD
VLAARSRGVIALATVVLVPIDTGPAAQPEIAAHSERSTLASGNPTVSDELRAWRVTPPNPSSKTKPAPSRRARHRVQSPDPSYVLPVRKTLLTPSLLLRSHHDYPAWDLALLNGTDVFAVHGGTVADVFAGGRCGQGVAIDGDDGYRYTYCHASTILVSPAAPVLAGMRIALSGDSGHSTGPHLHMEIATPSGDLLCPQPLLLDIYESSPVDPAQLPNTGCFYETSAGRGGGSDGAGSKRAEGVDQIGGGGGAPDDAGSPSPSPLPTPATIPRPDLSSAPPDQPDPGSGSGGG